MRERDRKLLEYLEKFRCLTSSQIASLLFTTNARPKLSANRTLLRLKNKGYVLCNSDRSFQDYIYFINPSPIKTTSQKIDHYLSIADGYLKLNEYSPVLRYDVEEKIPNTKFRSDAYCNWLDRYWFMEFQNSLYSASEMHQKIKRYYDYFQSEQWKEDLGLSKFPNILIIGKLNLKFDPTEFQGMKIQQVKTIDDLKDTIKTYKARKFEKFKEESMKPVKSEGGKISFTVK